MVEEGRCFPLGLRFCVRGTLELCNCTANGFHACTGFGHVWAKVSPYALEDLIEKNGSSELKSVSKREKSSSPQPKSPLIASHYPMAFRLQPGA